MGTLFSTEPTSLETALKVRIKKTTTPPSWVSRVSEVLNSLPPMQVCYIGSTEAGRSTIEHHIFQYREPREPRFYVLPRHATPKELEAFQAKREQDKIKRSLTRESVTQVMSSLEGVVKLAPSVLLSGEEATARYFSVPKSDIEKFVKSAEKLLVPLEGKEEKKFTLSPS